MTDEDRRNQYNLSRATKRLKRDLNLILTEPIPSIYVSPNEDDILDWHFVIQGRVNTPYENGMYHGRLVFPPNFPFGPPKILFITPNGRFKLNERICFSLSDFHPEEWKPAYSATAVLSAVYDFMHETTETIGSIETSDCVKSQLAIDSKKYNNNNDTFCRMFPDLCNQEMVADDYPVDETGEMDPSDEFFLIHTPTDDNKMDTDFVRPLSPITELAIDNTAEDIPVHIITDDVNTNDSQDRANFEYHNIRQAEHLTQTETPSRTQENSIVVDKDVIEYYRRIGEPIPGMVGDTYNQDVGKRPLEDTYVSRDIPTPVTAVVVRPITVHGSMTFKDVFPFPDKKPNESSISESISPVPGHDIGFSTPPNYNPIDVISGPVDDTILTRIPTDSPEVPRPQVTKQSKYILRPPGNSPIKRTLSPPNDVNVTKKSKYSPRVGPKLSQINKTKFPGPLPVTRHIPFTITPISPPYIHPPEYRIGYRLRENTPYYNRTTICPNLGVIHSANILPHKTQVNPREKIPSMYRSKGDLRDIEEGRKEGFTSLGINTSEVNCYYSALLLIAFLFAIALLFLLAVLTITLK